MIAPPRTRQRDRPLVLLRRRGRELARSLHLVGDSVVSHTGLQGQERWSWRMARSSPGARTDRGSPVWFSLPRWRRKLDPARADRARFSRGARQHQAGSRFRRPPRHLQRSLRAFSFYRQPAHPAGGGPFPRWRPPLAGAEKSGGQSGRVGLLHRPFRRSWRPPRLLRRRLPRPPPRSPAHPPAGPRGVRIPPVPPAADK